MNIKSIKINTLVKIVTNLPVSSLSELQRKTGITFSHLHKVINTFTQTEITRVNKNGKRIEVTLTQDGEVLKAVLNTIKEKMNDT